MRKHKLVLLGWVLVLFILFFPSLFMGRILSPNDVYYHYEPWRSVEQVEAQNPMIHDAPVSHYTLVSLLRTDPDAFHWNRFVGSGLPGTGSSESAVMSPLVFIPGLLLPLVFLYTGIIAGKLTVSLFFGYWWLREERLGKAGAAAGAVVISAAGCLAVSWLWQATNAAALYPAVFLVIARIGRGKRNSTLWLVVLGVSMALSGYPAATAYGGWLGLGYFGFVVVSRRLTVGREVIRAVAALILAAVISAPFLVPLVQYLERTTYREQRAEMSFESAFPLDYLDHFVRPFSHGDPGARRSAPEPGRNSGDNFVENTVYLGLLTIPLALLGALGAGSDRRFWLLAAIIILLSLYGGVSDLVGSLPGIRYSPITRLRLILPIPIAFLVASGVSWIGARLRGNAVAAFLRGLLPVAIVMSLALDLGLFAARFYGYPLAHLADIPKTPIETWLADQPGPFRVLPTFTHLFPNTAQLLRVEDIRAHWRPEDRYRAALARIDPSGASRSNLTLFNTLHADLTDPLLSVLSVRYIFEPPLIDIIRWGIYEKSTLSQEVTGEGVIAPGEIIRQQVDLDFSPAWAIEFTVHVRKTESAGAHVDLRVIRPETGEVIEEVRRTDEQLRIDPKVYLPMEGHGQTGNSFLVEIEARGLTAAMQIHTTENDRDYVYGRVSSPIVYRDQLPGTRIYENLAAKPRWYAGWMTTSRSFEEMLGDRALDLREVSVVRGLNEIDRMKLEGVPPSDREARITPVEYGGSHQRIRTRSEVPLLFATSERLTPELRLNVDGEPVTPIEVNGLFAGVFLERGDHEIVFSRRIGRGWWPSSFVALALTLIIGVAETLGPLTRNSRAQGD